MVEPSDCAGCCLSHAWTVSFYMRLHRSQAHRKFLSKYLNTKVTFLKTASFLHLSVVGDFVPSMQCKAAINKKTVSKVVLR